MTVGQYLAHWLEALRQTMRASSWSNHESRVRVHLTPALGRLRLARLGPQDIQRFEAGLLARGMAPTTARKVHATLSHALAEAERLGLVPRNVARLVRPPSGGHREMRPLDQGEARHLLAQSAAEGHRLHALWQLALETGMRQGEILALRWREVDLNGGSLLVCRTLAPKAIAGIWPRVTEPKTRRSRRTIALSHELVEALRAHRRRQASERIALGPAWTDHDLVFCDEAGGYLRSGRVRQTEFAGLLRRAGLPRVRFHDLRHTCATQLIARGADVVAVSELLGHTSVSITLDIYAHVQPAQRERTTAIMRGILYG